MLKSKIYWLVLDSSQMGNLSDNLIKFGSVNIGGCLVAIMVIDPWILKTRDQDRHMECKKFIHPRI